jgi:hypothetical protein
VEQLLDVPTFVAVKSAAWVCDSLCHKWNTSPHSSVGVATGAPSSWGVPSEAAFRGYDSLHCVLEDTKLKAVYGMHWWEGILGTAGKDGLCSVYKIPCAKAVRHRLACKLGVALWCC